MKILLLIGMVILPMFLGLALFFALTVVNTILGAALFICGIWRSIRSELKNNSGTIANKPRSFT